MKSILHKTTVLVLNRNWQAVGIKTPAEAFTMMASGAGTGLDVQGDEHITPVKWEDWLKLSIREEDQIVNTPRGAVRVPTVIVAANYDRVPMHRPKFGSQAIWRRDGGICQYTGQKLEPGEGNIDHIIPISRGGQTTWENCVLSNRKVNSKKGAKLPHEAGLRLLKKPTAPRAITATAMIKNSHDIPDWKRFLA